MKHLKNSLLLPSVSRFALSKAGGNVIYSFNELAHNHSSPACVKSIPLTDYKKHVVRHTCVIAFWGTDHDPLGAEALHL